MRVLAKPKAHKTVYHPQKLHSLAGSTGGAGGKSKSELLKARYGSQRSQSDVDDEENDDGNAAVVDPLLYAYCRDETFVWVPCVIVALEGPTTARVQVAVDDSCLAPLPQVGFAPGFPTTTTTTTTAISTAAATGANAPDAAAAAAALPPDEITSSSSASAAAAVTSPTVATAPPPATTTAPVRRKAGILPGHQASPAVAVASIHGNSTKSNCEEVPFTETAANAVAADDVATAGASSPFSSSSPTDSDGQKVSPTSATVVPPGDPSSSSTSMTTTTLSSSSANTGTSNKRQNHAKAALFEKAAGQGATKAVPAAPNRSLVKTTVTAAAADGDVSAPSPSPISSLSTATTTTAPSSSTSNNSGNKKQNHAKAALFEKAGTTAVPTSNSTNHVKTTETAAAATITAAAATTLATTPTEEATPQPPPPPAAVTAPVRRTSNFLQRQQSQGDKEVSVPTAAVAVADGVVTATSSSSSASMTTSTSSSSFSSNSGNNKQNHAKAALFEKTASTALPTPGRVKTTETAVVTTAAAVATPATTVTDTQQPPLPVVAAPAQRTFNLKQRQQVVTLGSNNGSNQGDQVVSIPIAAGAAAEEGQVGVPADSLSSPTSSSTTTTTSSSASLSNSGNKKQNHAKAALFEKAASATAVPTPNMNKVKTTTTAAAAGAVKPTVTTPASTFTAAVATPTETPTEPAQQQPPPAAVAAPVRRTANFLQRQQSPALGSNNDDKEVSIPTTAAYGVSTTSASSTPTSSSTATAATSSSSSSSNSGNRKQNHAKAALFEKVAATALPTPSTSRVKTTTEMKAAVAVTTAATTPATTSTAAAVATPTQGNQQPPPPAVVAAPLRRTANVLPRQQSPALGSNDSDKEGSIPTAAAAADGVSATSSSPPPTPRDQKSSATSAAVSDSSSTTSTTTSTSSSSNSGNKKQNHAKAALFEKAAAAAMPTPNTSKVKTTETSAAVSAATATLETAPTEAMQQSPPPAVTAPGRRTSKFMQRQESPALGSNDGPGRDMEMSMSKAVAAEDGVAAASSTSSSPPQSDGTKANSMSVTVSPVSDGDSSSLPTTTIVSSTPSRSSSSYSGSKKQNHAKAALFETAAAAVAAATPNTSKDKVTDTAVPAAVTSAEAATSTSAETLPVTTPPPPVAAALRRKAGILLQQQQQESPAPGSNNDSSHGRGRDKELSIPTDASSSCSSLPPSSRGGKASATSVTLSPASNRESYSSSATTTTATTTTSSTPSGVSLSSSGNQKQNRGKAAQFEISTLTGPGKTKAAAGDGKFRELIVDLTQYPNQTLPRQPVDRRGNMKTYADMSESIVSNEPSIFYNLKRRFLLESKPYTRCGDLLVAINPFAWNKTLYSEKKRARYSKWLVWTNADSDPRTLLEPHVYEVSALSYKGLAMEGLNQSILITGESGSGKTETAKILLHHIASVQRGPIDEQVAEEQDRLQDAVLLPGSGGSSTAASSGSTAATSDDGTCNNSSNASGTPSTTTEQFVSPIVQRILQANPLLEAFGNAKTRRNDNSSRFGKYTQLQFFKGDPALRQYRLRTKAICVLAGSLSEVYLLEKNRVCGRHDVTTERTFHIFYQLLAASDDYKKLIWPDGLAGKTVDDFKYIGPACTDKIEGVTDSDKFQQTVAALISVGLAEKSLVKLMRAICIVLQLGNCTFRQDPFNDDKTVVDNAEEFTKLSELMGISEQDLLKSFTERTMVTRGETFKVPLKVAAVREACDAFASEIYAKTFMWLVRTMNDATCAQLNFTCDLPNYTPTPDDFGIVGLLDIFGFETFPKNRFEQLCINYANEKLQQKATRDIFLDVMDEYKNEGIPLAEIDFSDNERVLRLIEGKTGLLNLLNEECYRPKGSDEAFVLKALTEHKDSPYLFGDKHNKKQFSIIHYAATVAYQADEFVTSNQDTLPIDLRDCAKKCSNEIISDHLLNESSTSERALQQTGKSKSMTSLRASTSANGDNKLELQQPTLLEGPEDTEHSEAVAFDIDKDVAAIFGSSALNAPVQGVNSKRARNSFESSLMRKGTSPFSIAGGAAPLPSTNQNNDEQTSNTKLTPARAKSLSSMPTIRKSNSFTREAPRISVSGDLDQARPPSRNTSTGQLTAPTVLSKYQKQLSSLMEMLSTTHTRYVRCIKPNPLKRPKVMDHQETVEQLRCVGIENTVRMTRAIFPNSVPNATLRYRFESMWDQQNYPSQARPTDFKELRIKLDVEALLTCALKCKEYKDDGRIKQAFVVGKTKTYFVKGALEYLEANRVFELDTIATKIQRHVRGTLTRHRLQRIRENTPRIQRWYRITKAHRKFRQMARKRRFKAAQNLFRK